MLTLNDEQEKALRAWFHTDSRPDLARAIAPLMHKWRVVDRIDGERNSAVIASGVIRIEVQSMIGYGADAVADRICRLLNESEAK